MRHSKSSYKKKVYSNTGLYQEKKLNKQSNITPKGTRKRTNKSELLVGNK